MSELEDEIKNCIEKGAIKGFTHHNGEGQILLCSNKDILGKCPCAADMKHYPFKSSKDYRYLCLHPNIREIIKQNGKHEYGGGDSYYYKRRYKNEN